MQKVFSTYEDVDVEFSFDNPFLRRLEEHSYNCHVYKKKLLLVLAKSLIPLDKLTEKVNQELALLRALGIIKNADVFKQYLMVKKLLDWFKTSFFIWVDNPKCRYCKMKTTFSHMSNDKRFINTDRVEMHKCTVCNLYTPFPRYNKLDILLMMRKGRSIESAKIFTLMCYAMGWEARYVVDESDHVWTEVFSVTQNRWLHCDPSENTINTPLMYEHGWNKKITYVMAYSIDDLQDVTWRYTSHYKEVLKRRKNCTETQLTDAIFKLRKERQKQLSLERITELTKRTLFELVEFIVENKPRKEERIGRTSSIIDFRLMERQVVAPFQWEIRFDFHTCVMIRYSTSLNLYQYHVDGVLKKEVHGWFNGVHAATNIIRHEDTDLKQVYLCREEGTQRASIQWKFKVNIPDMVIKAAVLLFQYETFHTDQIRVSFQEDYQETTLNRSGAHLIHLIASKTLQIKAQLSGGEEATEWQNARLFPQANTDNNFPFVVILIFADFDEK